MTTKETIRRHNHLSFRGNSKDTRYGWLRLTPAYSIHLVSELLDAQKEDNPRVLDPFCGTGTTALVCAERGIECDTTDINTFLLWLSQTKTHQYTIEEIENFTLIASTIRNAIQTRTDKAVWLPPLYQIEKWWEEDVLYALARAARAITEISATVSKNVSNLLKIAFCQTMISMANVSFSHQSMSFKQVEPLQFLPLFQEPPEEIVANTWRQSVSQIASSALSPIISKPNFVYGDARYLSRMLKHNSYSNVITSPPYPNRVSYIRELRPYMYWLGYLTTGREAGELDWQAIGGTWGCATSNLSKWEPDHKVAIPLSNFNDLLEKVAEQSPLLSKYIHKYFQDMVLHSRELFQVVRPGGTITYIIGNSKFYDVLLPVDTIFANIFESAGFTRINIRTIRKRSSKKELFEFMVSAKKD